MTCSAPEDCAEIERRHAGHGLRNGGASRGNLLSGEADHVILTVSRLGGREVLQPRLPPVLPPTRTTSLVRSSYSRGRSSSNGWRRSGRSRRDVRPRGHRSGIYPFMRGAMCTIVRDLIVFGVLSDLMKGRPAIYATFSSYDEVAHHSGLERADTLEALRKLDQQFARIDNARRYAPRPYEIVVLSDHGQTQGATFKQRNGYGLDDLVQRSLSAGEVAEFAGGDEQSAMVGHAAAEATGNDRAAEEAEERRLGPRRRRAGLREPRARLPHGGEAAADLRGDRGTPSEVAHRTTGAPPRRLAPVCSSEHGALVLGGDGTRYLADGRIEREDPLANFSPTPTSTSRGPTDSSTWRHHGRELLRPRPRRGLRLRGAISSTAGSADRRPGRSSSIPSSSRCRTVPSSGRLGPPLLKHWRASCSPTGGRRPVSG